MENNYKIPSSIVSKLEQIKLYMETNSVTAFVGAGFSLNAEIPNNVKMKTWPQLKDTFLNKLYANNDDDKINDSNDVVRLSSLIDAQFGHNELDNILEDALPDHLIQPGKLHRMLIQLSWKDIITTNYDTLIERAASQVISNYKLVTNKETLLYQPSPRIIKLHGSFPNIRPYIMTQEDYRRYPIDRPEMVNTARQCFLESLVCLIGFSGDDPNFRAWIGWLKDIIGQKRLCPTYLITYNKGFHDAEKALLSQMGIDIINLAEIDGINSFSSAYEFFFNYLQKQPSTWNGSVRYESIFELKKMKQDEFAIYINNKIEEMQNIRISYPGWLLLPKSYENDFNDINENIVDFENCFKLIKDDDIKFNFLYELNWRMTVANLPKDCSWFIKAIEDFSKNADKINNEHRKYLIELQLSLLEILRHTNKDEKFCQLCDNLLKCEDSTLTRYVKYQQVLYWITKYDFKKANKILAEWKVDFSDYQNCLQKANILCCIGKRFEAYQILKECKDIICKSLFQNKENIYAKSCLTYILNTINLCNAGSKTEIDSILNFAIGESFNDITERLYNKAYKDKSLPEFTRKHLFEIGNYANSWNIGSSGFVHEYLYPYKWWSLKEKIGISMQIINQNFSKYCIQQMFNYSWEMAWNMMMISADTKIVEQVFGRQQLSCITEDEANKYFDTYFPIFENYDINTKDWSNCKVLYILPIVLGRLCTRISQERVIQFTFAALKWPSILINKSLKYAYDCLNNKNLSDIFEHLLTEKDYYSPYTGKGYTFPDRYMINYKITEPIIERIINGFTSRDNEKIRQSIYFLEIIWHKKDLPESNKELLAHAVRNVRNTENPIQEVMYTYLYVDANEDEEKNLRNILDNDTKTFCHTTYQYKESSESFSQWHSILKRINILNQYISAAQMKDILLHNYELVELNRASFEEDDSYELLGGIRKFTTDIIKVYQSLFIKAQLCDWNDQDIRNITSQIDWLKSKDYHCLPMKVKVLTIDNLNINDDLLEEIKSTLFSRTENIQREGINALFVLKENKGDISKILNYIFEVFTVADSKVYKELLILFANLIADGYTEDDFINHIIQLLNCIHRNYNNYGLDQDALLDLLHYTNFVTGTLYIKSPNNNYMIFKKEDVKFNDVEIGFDKGIEFMQRRNFY